MPRGLRTIVGTDPRFPATAMKPHSRNDTMMPRQPDDERRPEGDAEVEHECAVAEAEDRDVGGEPWPEQVPRVAFTLRVADDIDPVDLDLQRVQIRPTGGRDVLPAATVSHGQLSFMPVTTARQAG